MFELNRAILVIAKVEIDVLILLIDEAHSKNLSSLIAANDYQLCRV